MRHVFGIIAGIVLAPLLPLAIGYGMDRVAISARNFSSFNSYALVGLGALLLAGVIIGLLASTRWLSPVASLIVGVVYVAVTAVFVAPGTILAELLPSDGLLGDLARWIWVVTAQGFLGLLGVALVVSSLTPRRWRRERREDPDLYLSQMRPDEPPNPAMGPMGTFEGQSTAQYTMPHTSYNPPAEHTESSETPYGPAGPPRY